MLNRTIPFFNLILKCDEYAMLPENLPEGYRIVSYQPGIEADWARLECAVGDFENEKEAADYFCEKYLQSDRSDDILFLTDRTGNVIGSCIAWSDERNGKPVNSLHWLIVDEKYQGKKLGRSLCTAVMNRFYRKGGWPVYIHTQPWSWKAILLYSSLGFRLQRSDSFAEYSNQYDDAVKTLKQILSEEQIRLLEDKSEE